MEKKCCRHEHGHDNCVHHHHENCGCSDGQENESVRTVQSRRVRKKSSDDCCGSGEDEEPPKRYCLDPCGVGLNNIDTFIDYGQICIKLGG